MSKNVTMRSDNKGLTVKINIWSLEKFLDKYDSARARLFIRGQATHADTGKTKIFNDAGELITILGKWNAEKVKKLKRNST